MLKYGITEVYVQHDYYISLRISLLRKTDSGYILLKDQGDRFDEIREYEPKTKIYEAPANFLPTPSDFQLYYVYEKTEVEIPRYKYILHRGTSRSSKTWTLCEWSARTCETTSNIRINVWRDTRESLSGTVWSDFKKIFPLSGRNYRFPQRTDKIYLGENSTIEPHGADTTNAHGNTQDYAWLNEPYNIPEETFNQIDQRSNQVIIDMNPRNGHFTDKLSKNPRCKVIHSTFMKNPFCPIEQKTKLLSYEPWEPGTYDIVGSEIHFNGKPISPSNQPPPHKTNVANETANEYMWVVYGLGLKAERPNRIFRGWNKITYFEFLKLPYRSFFGVDWGKNHKFGIVELKFDRDGNKLYCHQRNYKSENELLAEIPASQQDELRKDSGGIVVHTFAKLGIPNDAYIVCDSSKPDKILALRDIDESRPSSLRWEYALGIDKPKGSVMYNITLLDSTKVYYTVESEDFDNEYHEYSYAEDRMGVVDDEVIKLFDDLMDPTMYGRRFAQHNPDKI